MRFKIDRELLKMKAHYFMTHAAVAPIIPYIATYARQLGFSSVSVGILAAILSFASFILKPLFGYLGDRYHMRKTLVLISLVVIAVTLMVTNYIPPLAPIVSFERRCAATTDGHNVLEYCPQIEQRSGCLIQQVLAQRSNDDLQMRCQLNCFPSNGDANSSVTAEPILLEIDMTHVSQVDECLHFAVRNRSSHCTATTVTPPSSFNCTGTCDDPNVMAVLGNNREDTDRPDSMSPQLWTFVVCITLATAGVVGTATVSNAMCFALLGERTHRFGHQRVWGSLGWGIFAIMSGFIVDAMSGGKVMKDYSGLFYIMLVVIVCNWFVALMLKNVHTTTSTNMLSKIGRVFLKPRMIVFFVWCIAVGLGSSLIANFLFWHLEEMSESDEVTCEATAPYIKTLQGLAMGVQTFGGDVPMYLLSGTLFKRIGYAHSMSLVLAAFGLRFVLYSVLTNYWWVLPIELLQGFTGGLFICAMYSYANLMAPVGAEATLQGVSSAIYEGIGRTIGALVGGYGVQKIGIRMMFGWFGYIAFGLCGVHVVVHLVLNRFCKPDERSDAIREVTEDILSANMAEQRNETNDKHKFTTEKF